MNAKSWIKGIVSVGMILLILRYVNFSSLAQQFRSIPLWAPAIIIVGYFLGQILSSFKWLLIARSGGVSATFAEACKAYFIGMFVNCFGLGIVGGDVARGLLLSVGKPTKTVAMVSVIADRVHGLAVLALIGAVATALFGAPHLSARAAALFVVLGLGLPVGWFVGPWLLDRVMPRGHRLRARVDELVRAFPRTPRTILTISVLSALFHSLQIVLHACMASAVGAPLPWSILFVVIPIVNIASSLPISWMGVGVRESAYIYFLASVPAAATAGGASLLSREQALAFGAMWLLAVTVTSAIGGLVAFLSGDLGRLREASTRELETQQMAATTLR